MNIKKYLMLGGVALSLGLSTSSCIGDLDLEPIDPSQTSADTSSMEFIQNSFAQCYANLGFCSTTGPGESNLSVPDAGASVYVRLLFALNEMTTDEAFWIWKDNGLDDLVCTSYGSANLQVLTAYQRFYQHVATCNTFLEVTEGMADPEVLAMRTEVRALRAFTYYWLCDMFGNVTLSISKPDGEGSPQVSRAELYNWLEGELTDLVDNGNLPQVPVYGRVGIDGVEALLARLYLNAPVYAGVEAWDKCLTRCNNIINRHKGGGYQGSGLAQHYIYLFCGNNEEYMPGGGNVAENEILWGVPFDAIKAQSYGGSSFMLLASLSEGMYGSLESWSCLTAGKLLSERFESNPEDKRWQFWIRDGKETDNVAFGTFSTAGYQAIKWTNLVKEDNSGNLVLRDSYSFCNSDLALIRLADVYLMRTECFMHGVGDQTEALAGINYVRNRAGLGSWGLADLTFDNLLDERSRELYYECTRRSDLIRYDRFTGPNQMVWPWKGYTAEGTTIGSQYNLLPIPANIIAAQPDLKQNPGFN